MAQVRMNKFPQPVKLSARITAWKVEEVRAWIGQGRVAVLMLTNEDLDKRTG